MAGISNQQHQAEKMIHGEYNIHEGNAALIRAIQEVGGKECFAAAISHLCPNLDCRWRGECLRLATYG